MTIFFNSITNGFYDSNISEIPENSIEITAEHHKNLLELQSAGYAIRTDEHGNPIATKPVLTPEEITAKNKLEKQKLLETANKKIEILQDIIDLNMCEGGEADQLKLWKRYRVLLTRVDVNSADVDVDFPLPPN
ncbi:tail fiber assembly protein [Gilliamella sp. CG16]|uniref:tail fiber assembly protein n=1 Tax=Gilliamella sp. CG16 TaxID=3351503 RepID=UPI003987683B